MPRLAELKDKDGILQLYRALRPNDPELGSEASEKALSEIINSPNADIIVAEHNGKLSSTCMLGTVPSMAMAGRPFGVIEHVITLPEARGNGLGKAVLTFALNQAWDMGCYKVLLLSGAQRVEAHRLYESVGFIGDVEKGFVAKP
ncbi:GNAT family N-acetyltransferase [Microbulbifer sp. CAU 1566]|uniref:GNAT family N-acetyltransferase n=1 Tax=Microbulbifer sp. CAU 1566 TaxID=2933269 RepID=UPI00200380BE|nr:GNAT family N-acetyltransferase [Microbulbifer sp. CAU 1566]MCK7596365.1 GNAT family N-acetyltransferase [Microbulbifer sp. CAU 1566]